MYQHHRNGEVNRLIVFRHGLIRHMFIDGDLGEIEVEVGDVLTDGLLWFERGEYGEQLIHAGDPRIKVLEHLIPADTNRGWLLAKMYAPEKKP